MTEKRIYRSMGDEEHEICIDCGEKGKRTEMVLGATGYGKTPELHAFGFVCESCWGNRFFNAISKP